MIRGLLSLYSWRYPQTIVYMLQSTEYQVGPYLRWVWRTFDFSRVAQRRTLHLTRPARLLRLAVTCGCSMQIAFGISLIILWGAWEFGLSLLISYPIVWAHLILLPLILGRYLIIRPRQRRLVKQSEVVFRNHPGIKIAIAGSYGKTSMKELLLTVLSEGKRVAATPANKNVAISHAAFAQKLTGNEDILLIEYGEGQPGDVTRFAATTHPTHAIITGLAPAHLDRYKSLEAAGQDIFSLAEAVDNRNVYVTTESQAIQPFIRKEFQTYSHEATLGWKVEAISINLTGTSFTLRKGTESTKLQSGLIGQHQIGPLALAAALALQFGLSREQVVDGIAKTRPFEHRMQPYQLSGAWIIDDTYNGNIEGVRAGLALLQQLPAPRKIYVTPGLVDQGNETGQVHQTMGRLIAGAQPDIVVLMRHSVTPFIQQGLQAANFKGSLRIEANPLAFYTNLSHFVASGDLVLMQNDWPDNYV